MILHEPVEKDRLAGYVDKDVEPCSNCQEVRGPLKEPFSAESRNKAELLLEYESALDDWHESQEALRCAIGELRKVPRWVRWLCGVGR